MEQLPSQENMLYPKISEELNILREKDQEMRNSGNFDDSVDIVNTMRFKEIIDEIGWPTVSKVGKMGASTAWLLVQHADLDVPFQEECLLLMEENKSDIDTRHISYLADRVRVNKNMPQIYGTQFRGGGNTQYGPAEIEDPGRLEERRNSMGLESFEEYQNKMIDSNKKFEERKKGKG